MPVDPNVPERERLFQTTHWSVVLSAGEPGPPAASEALEKLCAAYWPPVYAYARREGHLPHDAEDLTQEFFLRVLDRRYLAQADPRRGRFRNFLLVAFKHFLANEWDRARAVKRGGRVTFLSLDACRESEEAWKTSERESPDQAFARTWALVFLERVLGRLRAEFEREEQRRQFDELKGYLVGDSSNPTYAHVALKLGSTEAAIKMAVQRLRTRFAGALREEVSHTVASPDEINDEIRALFAAVST